jgi:hypothetical protein
LVFVKKQPAHFFCDDDKRTGDLETPRYGVRELAPAFGAAGCGSPCESGGKPPHSIFRLPPVDGFYRFVPVFRVYERYLPSRPEHQEVLPEPGQLALAVPERPHLVAVLVEHTIPLPKMISKICSEGRRCPCDWLG